MKIKTIVRGFMNPEEQENHNDEGNAMARVSQLGRTLRPKAKVKADFPTMRDALIETLHRKCERYGVDLAPCFYSVQMAAPDYEEIEEADLLEEIESKLEGALQKHVQEKGLRVKSAIEVRISKDHELDAGLFRVQVKFKRNDPHSEDEMTGHTFPKTTAPKSETPIQPAPVQLAQNGRGSMFENEEVMTVPANRPLIRSVVAPQSASSEAPEVVLEVIKGAQSKEFLPVTQWPAVIGRATRQNKPTIGIQDAENIVGRQHATLKWENETLFIRDEKSRNGTRLNGRKLSDNQWRALGDGDEVTLAEEIVLRLHCADSEKTRRHQVPSAATRRE